MQDRLREGFPAGFFWTAIITVGCVLVLGGAGLWAVLVLAGEKIPAPLAEVIGLVVLAVNVVVLGLIGKGGDRTQRSVESAAMSAAADRETQQRQLDHIRTVVQDVADEVQHGREVALRAIVRSELQRAFNGGDEA